MTISLDSKSANELITTKLNSILKVIDDILVKWNQKEVEMFIQNAFNGILVNAEMDAITVKQLVKDFDRLQSLLSTSNPTVSLDKKLTIDLADTKLNTIIQEINTILSHWKYEDSDKFINDAKKGLIDEAEDDAISLRNLLDKREELIQLKESWS